MTDRRASEHPWSPLRGLPSQFAGGGPNLGDESFQEAEDAQDGASEDVRAALWLLAYSTRGRSRHVRSGG